MKKIITTLAILAVFASCKKEELSPNLTKEFSIQSTSNGANYKIKVGVPENYSPGTQNYATIYLLDGEEIFDYVAEESNKKDGNTLVVSIGYGNDRALDYTPTDVAEGDGGAEKFMHFIKDELIPRMESGFGADASRGSRVILGHSFGGLFAAYAFANYNNVFGNYIMLSPSLWYDNEIVMKQEQQNRSVNSANHQLVFMGLGELENEGRMLAPFQAFYETLQSNYPGIAITRHFAAGLDHTGSRKPNIDEGLNFYFQNR